CYHQEVRVEVKGQARYQRTIAEVILPDGRILNYEIVKAGLAWWFRRYAPKDPTLEGLEFQARQAQRGLWSDRDPVPPWEFRKNKPAPHTQRERKFWFSAKSIAKKDGRNKQGRRTSEVFICQKISANQLNGESNPLLSD